MGWALTEGGEAIDLATQTVTADQSYHALFISETVHTAKEFSEQFSHYGTPSVQTAKNRIRTSCALKLKAGAVFTFSGDTSVYKWSVNETQNTAKI